MAAVDFPRAHAAERPARSRAVAIWLFVIAALVVAMVLVGGLTRLTDSGLSITEWKPVTGALPPLSDAAWQDEFGKYQRIPEFQIQNHDMTLGEFKGIYLWEWGHRLLGRLIGLAFAVPLLVFWLRRMIPVGLGRRLVVVFLLGGLQGAVGWWMVASGLSGRIDVSQYRLATHLGVAFLLLGALWWTALDAEQGAPFRWRGSRAAWVAAGLLGLVSVQILLGAFVAGLDGGRTYTEWPLVQGRLVPEVYGALEPFWRNPLENPVAAQIDHRFAGYLVVIAALAAPFAIGRGAGPAARRTALAAAAVALAQAALGVATLMHAAPLGLSAIHQIGGAVLFLAAVTLARTAGTAPAAER